MTVEDKARLGRRPRAGVGRGPEQDTPIAHPASTLFIVSTPIGNLEDITLRALRVLREASLIAAEDTRVTRKLLSHYDIHTPLTSFHEHSRGEKADSLIERLVQGESIALVSDAGTPGISDPGAVLVGAALTRGIRVVPIPGANAAVTAVTVSGLPSGRFAFEGFPPRTKTDRRAFFRALQPESRSIILYESPGRLLDTLTDLYNVLGDRPIAVARELTKMFEEIHRGTLSSSLCFFGQNKPRGEFTLVVGGCAPEASTPGVAESDIPAALRVELKSGSTPRDAVQHVADDLHLPRRLVYRALIQLQRDGA